MSEPLSPPLTTVGDPTEAVSDAEPQPTPPPVPTAGPSEASEAAGGSERAGKRVLLVRIAALVAIAIGVGIIVWLIARDSSDPAPTSPTSATAVTPAELENVATSVGHPIFWLGPRDGTTYELVRASNGSIFVRYLPAGAEVGTAKPYLTVATYPFAGAYAAIKAVTQQSGSTAIPIAGNGLAESSATTATSVHAAYPGLDYQAEVFDPTPGTAAALVKADGLTSLGARRSGAVAAAGPHTASRAELRTLAAALGHPVYWAGPKPGFNNELRTTADGRVYIRYLPKKIAAGDGGEYLTVGTYPYPGAFAALEALAKQANTERLQLPEGGVAVIDGGSPKNIHLAYPKSGYQIEVFDPSAAAARRVVTTGKVTSIG